MAGVTGTIWWLVSLNSPCVDIPKDLYGYFDQSTLDKMPSHISDIINPKVAYIKFALLHFLVHCPMPFAGFAAKTHTLQALQDPHIVAGGASSGLLLRQDRELSRLSRAGNYHGAGWDRCQVTRGGQTVHDQLPCAVDVFKPLHFC